jgi:hypothetical protein
MNESSQYNQKEGISPQLAARVQISRILSLLISMDVKEKT